MDSGVERVFGGGNALTTRQGGHPSTDEVGAVGYACTTRSPGGHAFATALVSGVSTRESRSSVEGRWPMICQSHASRRSQGVAWREACRAERSVQKVPAEWAAACRMDTAA